MPNDLEVGKYSRRLESAITVPMDNAIKDVAADMAGGEDGNFRSKAARRLIALGYAAYQKERRTGGARKEPAEAVV